MNSEKYTNVFYFKRICAIGRDGSVPLGNSKEI